MSKKARHIKKRLRTRREIKHPDREDRHHIFFMRKSWAGGLRGKLRNHWYSVKYIPKNTLHHEIHEAVKCVPIPRESSVNIVLYHLKLLQSQNAIHEGDTLERRLVVLIALFDYIEQPTADALRKQLEIVRRFYNNPSIL